MSGQSKSVNPLISVIVPAYNAEVFITDTLRSALDQTYENIEVLVVDDGSYDRTADIVEAIAEQDSRIRLFRGANQGVAAARNLAIEHARGEYIAPLDADDIWYPQKLQKQLACLSGSDANVGLVYAWSVHIDETGGLTGGCIASEVEGDAYLPLVYSNFVGNASTPLIRRECFERVGGYSPWYRQHGAEGSEDRELYMRVAEYYRFRLVPEFLVGYRQVANSMSCKGTSMARAHALLLAEVRRKHPEIPRRIFRWSESRSCWYLGQKCSRCDDHVRALSLLGKAVCFDSLILTNRQLYALVLKNLRKLTVRVLPQTSSKHAEPTRKSEPIRPASAALTVADLQRRKQERRRLWQRLHVKRMAYLSALGLPDMPAGAGVDWRRVGSGAQTGGASWHRP
jgi:glycosyltransferase involved in cell wall biosynthesis